MEIILKQVVRGSVFVQKAVQTDSCLYVPYPKASGMFPAPPHP